MNPPLVTIYVPTHNRIEMLKRAVKSLQAQALENFEAIIVDDGSKDGTEAYLQELVKIDSRFRFFRHEQPKGACAARNKAIFAARGKYITGLDDDDEFVPNRLQRMLSEFKEDHAFICATFYAVSGNGKKLVPWQSGSYSLQDILSRNITSQVLTKTERLQAIGGFDERLSSCQDYDCWVRLMQLYGPAQRLAEPLMLVHEHEHGQITGSVKAIRGQLRFFAKHKHLMTPANIKNQRFMVAHRRRQRISVCFFLATIFSDKPGWKIRCFLASNLAFLLNMAKGKGAK